MTGPQPLTLTEDEIQILLKLLTEDQLAVSLNRRVTNPDLELAKQSVWEKLHDALDGLHSAAILIH